MSIVDKPTHPVGLSTMIAFHFCYFHGSYFSIPLSAFAVMPGGQASDGEDIMAKRRARGATSNYTTTNKRK